MAAAPTIHASAVLVGARAVLIQGPSGSGKSRLALALVQAAAAGILPFARLVGDDRVHIEAAHGRLLVSPAAALAGQIEVRGLGIRRMVHESAAVVGLIVDLGSIEGERLPASDQQETVLAGVRLPRLAVAAGNDPLPLLLAHLRIRPGVA
jgi:HPr kinase/phosphorylase